MADLCKQCSMELFGEDPGDLRGLCGPDEMVATLCEGCGNCYVDSEGACITPDCLKKHGVQDAQE